MAEPILLSADEARELAKNADIRVQEVLATVDTAIRAMCAAGMTKTNIGMLHEDLRIFADTNINIVGGSTFAKKVIDEIRKRGFTAEFKKDGAVWDARPRLFGAGEGREEEWKQTWSVFVSW
jgi:hypothetical protein